MTQGELAQQVGCSGELIRKIEADARRPSTAIAERLAVFLDLPSQQRAIFVKVARTELRTDWLPDPNLLADTPPAEPRVCRLVLPVPLTPLIGRERDLETVHAILLRSDVRLLTLRGPPGIGKTRLAIQAAADLHDAFADGVYFVGLAPIRDPRLVVWQIAQTLGVQESREQALVQSLAFFLRDRQLLLILDNFEHVVAAATTIAELLAAAPSVKVLVTSRAILHLSGEHEFAVPPLALPIGQTTVAAEITGFARSHEQIVPLHTTPPLAEIRRSAAVELFVYRVRMTRLDFALNEENADAVAAICVRLDGVPLAIELAAARCKLFDPPALLDRLRSCLDLLTLGVQDLLRHRTLRDAITWSYDLLSRYEQALFRRLGVFTGGWTLAAAETVASELSSENRELKLGDAHFTERKTEYSMLDRLASLVDQSLIRREVGAVGEVRFTMLETIREYALERLEASGEAAAMRQRHAEYFLALAEKATQQLRGAEPGVWLDRLEVEHSNLRAMLAWALGGGNIEIGVRLAVALAGSRWEWSFWSERAYVSEGSRWLEAALEQSSVVAPSIRAQALLRAVDFAFFANTRDSERDQTRIAEALVLFKQAGDPASIAYMLTTQGITAWEDADYTRATRFLEEALAIYRDLGDRYGMAEVLHWLGDVARDQGAIARGAVLLEESVALYRELGDVTGAAGVLNGLGDVACVQGDYVRATALYWEAVEYFHATGARVRRIVNIIWPLHNLGWMALMRGDDGRVLALLEECEAWFREQKAIFGLSYILHLMGALINVQGNVTRATTLLREALALQPPFGAHMITEGLDAFAWMAFEHAQPTRAARLLGAAEAMLMGGTGFPSWRSAHEHIVAAVSTQLDEVTFAAAWAAGQALPLEEVIVEALAVEGQNLTLEALE